MSIIPPSSKDVLRQAGFRATPSRLALVDLLRSTEKPFGTPEIVKRVGDQMDLATLYRILRAFEQKGFIKNLPLDGRHASYEWIHEDHHHHHLVCRTCGQIEDIEDCDLELLEKSLLKRSKNFKEIAFHTLEFFGTCIACHKSSS